MKGAEHIARLKVFELNKGDHMDYFKAKSQAERKESRLVKLEKRILRKNTKYVVKEGSISYATPHFSWYKA